MSRAGFTINTCQAHVQIHSYTHTCTIRIYTQSLTDVPIHTCMHIIRESSSFHITTHSRGSVLPVVRPWLSWHWSSVLSRDAHVHSRAQISLIYIQQIQQHCTVRLVVYPSHTWATCRTHGKNKNTKIPFISYEGSLIQNLYSLNALRCFQEVAGGVCIYSYTVM